MALPSSKTTFTPHVASTPTNKIEPITASDVNKIQTAITGIEDTVGITGESGTHTKRIADLETASGNAVKIQGRNVSTATPSDTQVLKWNATSNQWEPATDNTSSGGAGATNLTTSLSSTTVGINSDTGTDVTIAAADATNAGVMTSAMQVKLGGIASGATANSSDATLLARANHTGTQSADTITDGTTNKAFLATERTKLAAITGTNTGDQTIGLTGDVTGSGTGSFAATLATVNSNVGSFGSSSLVPVITVNAKGLVTGVTTASVSGGGGSALTVQDEGTTLSSAVTQINFTGGGVTATGTTSVTVNVPTGSGTGDVVGPASSTASALAIFNSTTGKLLASTTATLPSSVTRVPALSSTSYAAMVDGVVMVADTTDGRIKPVSSSLNGIARFSSGTINQSQVNLSSIGASTPDVFGSLSFENSNYGWNETAETLTYASNTTVGGNTQTTWTVATGAASRFAKGMALRFKQTSSSYGTNYIYQTVISIASTTSIVTTGGSDYVPNSGTVTSFAPSYVPGPAGFPFYFNYTPTYGAGVGAFNSVTTTEAKFCFIGSRIEVSVFATGTTTGAGNTGIRFYLPVVTTGQASIGVGQTNDNGTYVLGYGQIAFSGTLVATNKYDSTAFGVGTNRGFQMTISSSF